MTAMHSNIYNAIMIYKFTLTQKFILAAGICVQGSPC